MNVSTSGNLLQSPHFHVYCQVFHILLLGQQTFCTCRSILVLSISSYGKINIIYFKFGFSFLFCTQVIMHNTNTVGATIGRQITEQDFYSTIGGVVNTQSALSNNLCIICLQLPVSPVEMMIIFCLLLRSCLSALECLIQ